MKKTLYALLVFAVSGLMVNAQELPATAEPGKCYVKCITQDEFRDVTETVVVSPAYKKLKVVPATYKTVDEKVLVKEASKKLVYVPAVYETVEVPYSSKGESSTIEVVPAVFGSDTKVIQTAPTVGKWEYTKLANCPSANKEDCVVACYVEQPAKSEAVTITTLVSDAKTRSVSIPGAQNTYRKQVVKTAARMEEVEIPAEYQIIHKQVVDRAAQVVEENVPAVTRTVTKSELVKKGGMTVWEEIDCRLTGSANILPILWDYNSAQLTPASERIIDENLVKLMNNKPGIRVEIMSHTDSRGNDDFNMTLSQQRAQSVVNYLVSKGISRSRLVAKGYGETRLKNRCSNGVDCTEAEHQVNRRTEFRIL